jgi:hypothetical protein
VIYAIICITVGFHFPRNGVTLALIVVSVLASAVVGVLRARYTRLWQESDRIYSQGTRLTIGLFIGCAAVDLFQTADG